MRVGVNSRLEWKFGNLCRAGYSFCVRNRSYEAKAVGSAGADSVNSGGRGYMRDGVYNVPHRGKLKQKTCIGILRLDASIPEDGVAIAMLRVTTAERRKRQEWH